ncbi:MAG: hypothetical protein RIQ33_1244 [Bacteroidota bacterium]|jgi:predicted transcriptional regulator
MKKKLKKSDILQSLSKMMVDKEDVVAYIKGKKSLSSLTKKGIHFAKPI